VSKFPTRVVCLKYKWRILDEFLWKKAKRHFRDWSFV